MGSWQTRDQTRLPCIGRRMLNHRTARESPSFPLEKYTSHLSLLSTSAATHCPGFHSHLDTTGASLSLFSKHRTMFLLFNFAESLYHKEKNPKIARCSFFLIICTLWCNQNEQILTELLDARLHTTEEARWPRWLWRPPSRSWKSTKERDYLNMKMKLTFSVTEVLIKFSWNSKQEDFIYFFYAHISFFN